MAEPASPRKAVHQHALVRPCDDESPAPGLELDDLQSSEPASKVATDSDSKMASIDNPLALDFVQQDVCEAKVLKPTEAVRRSPDQSGIPSISNLHPNIRVQSSYTETKSASNSTSNFAESSPDRNQKTPLPKELRSSFGFRGRVHKKRGVMQAGWDDIDSERSDIHGPTENGSMSEVNTAPSPVRPTRKALTIDTEDLMDYLKEVKYASSKVIESDSSASPVCEPSSNSVPMDSPVSEMADTKLPYSPLGVKRLKYNVKPPKTPSGSSRYEPTDSQDNLSATQRVRVGLSEYIGTGTPEKSRLVMDKSQHAGGSHGPASCPPMFRASGKQQFSTARASQHQGQEVRPSKFLPNHNLLNCLMGYIHELHQSESSLRAQLATFKQQADAKLADALARHILLEQELSQSRKIIADQHKRIRELTRDVSYGSEAEEHQPTDSDFEDPDSCSFGLCDSPPSLVGKMEVLYRKSLLQNEMIANSVRNQGIRNIKRWDGRELFNPDAGTAVRPTSANLVVELGGSAAHPVMSPTIKPLWNPWSSGGSDVSLSSCPPMFTIAPSTSDVLPHGSVRYGVKTSSHSSPCLKSIISTPGKIFGRLPKDEVPVFETSTLQNQVLSTVVSKIQNDLPPLIPVKGTSSEQKLVNALDQISEYVAKRGQLSEHPLSRESARPTEQTSSEKVDEVVISQANVGKAPPITLEKLLQEFYKENDKPKESMAHVYAKRYQGRESWLFTELSKRYSNDKVAALKDRFAECAQTSDISSAEKDGRRSMYELSSALKVAMDQDIRLPSETIEPLSENATDSSPTRRSTQTVSSNARKLPLHRATMTPLSHALAMTVHSPDALKTTSEEPKKTEEVSSPSIENPVCEMNKILDSKDEDTFASTPVAKNPQENLDTESKLAANRPPPLQPATNNSLVNSKASPIVRQGELSRGTISPPTGSPMVITKELSSSPRKKSSIRQYPTCSITLEALLRDLYRSHEPNELRNVQHVADEFRGNERELIAVLKSKYGALSVKRLEENLATLEKLAQAHSRRQNQKRFRAWKMGAKVVLAAVAGIASCAVGIGLVHSQLCHDRSQHPEPEQRGNGPSCLIPADLTFGIDRAISECSMTPVDAMNAFCTEWTNREESWLTTHSMTDALELLKALPFSPLVDFPYRSLVDSALFSLDVPSILGDTAKSVLGVLSEITTPSLLAENDSSLIHLDDSVHEALTKAALASKLLADSTIALVSHNGANESTVSHDEKIAGLVQDEQGIDEELDVLSWLTKNSMRLQRSRVSAAREISSEKLRPTSDISQQSSDVFPMHIAATEPTHTSSHSAVCELVTAAKFAVNTNVCTFEQHLHVQEFYAQDPGTLLALAEQAALAQLKSSCSSK